MCSAEMQMIHVKCTWTARACEAVSNSCACEMCGGAVEGGGAARVEARTSRGHSVPRASDWPSVGGRWLDAAPQVAVFSVCNSLCAEKLRLGARNLHEGEGKQILYKKWLRAVEEAPSTSYISRLRGPTPWNQRRVHTHEVCHPPSRGQSREPQNTALLWMYSRSCPSTINCIQCQHLQLSEFRLERRKRKGLYSFEPHQIRF